jgi:hypothetical protein
LIFALLVSGCASSPRIDNSQAIEDLAAQGSQHRQPQIDAVAESVKIPDESKIKPLRVNKKMRTAVEAAVRDQLKDPFSAKFGSMQANQGEKGIVTVCGWVNAKNSFGAFIGQLPFFAGYVSSTGKSFIIKLASGEDDARLVAVECINNGTPL